MGDRGRQEMTHQDPAPPFCSRTSRKHAHSARRFSLMLALLLPLSLWAGYWQAQRHNSDPVVQTMPTTPGVPRRSTISPLATVTPADPAGASQTCFGAAPGPSWACSNGIWVMASTVQTTAVGPGASGGGGGGIGGCVTAQPGPSFTCQAGVWVANGSGAGETQAASAADAPRSDAAPAGTGCSSAQPGPGWICSGGTWVLSAMATSPTRSGTVSSPSVPVDSTPPIGPPEPGPIPTPESTLPGTPPRAQAP